MAHSAYARDSSAHRSGFSCYDKSCASQGAMHAQVLASIAGNECAMPTPPFPVERHSSAYDIVCLVGRTRCGGTVPLISPHNDIPLPALLKRFVLIYFPIVLIFSAAVAASIWRDGQRR